MTLESTGWKGKKKERVNLTGGDEKVEQWKGKEGKDNEESHTYQS